MIDEEEQLKIMKDDAMTALQEAVTKLHNYACACELGPEREKAFEIYQNALHAPRVF